jgi:hypothetical protein
MWCPIWIKMFVCIPWIDMTGRNNHHLLSYGGFNTKCCWFMVVIKSKPDGLANRRSRYRFLARSHVDAETRQARVKFLIRTNCDSWICALVNVVRCVEFTLRWRCFRTGWTGCRVPCRATQSESVKKPLVVGWREFG